MEEEEVSESQEEIENNESEGEMDMGFDEPLPNPNDPVSKKRERPADSKEMKKLKSEICKLLSRYPTLVPRSSNLILEKLSEMSEEELHNVYQNCVNDLVEIRGTPVAKFSIFILTKVIDDRFLPGFTDECMKDPELKRDIESEIINILGELSNRVNIFFRFINNAYVAYKRARREYHHVEEEKLQNNASTQQSPFVKPIEIGQEHRQSKEVG